MDFRKNQKVKKGNEPIPVTPEKRRYALNCRGRKMGPSRSGGKKSFFRHPCFRVLSPKIPAS